MATTLKISYRRAGSDTWRGVLKDEAGNAVWTCDHCHQNRDNGSWTNGISARGCAGAELRRRLKCEAA